MTHRTDLVNPRPPLQNGHGTFDLFGDELRSKTQTTLRPVHRHLAAVVAIVCAALAVAVIVLSVVLSVQIRKSSSQNSSQQLYSNSELLQNRISDSLLGNYSQFGAAADNGECSAIARNILISGGNVVDAAIAADFCIGILTAHSCGIGGGFFMTIYNSTTKECTVIDARETAPLASNRTMFVGQPSNETSTSQTGWLAVATPGELHGLYTAHEAFGSLPWKQLLQPTIRLLRNGYTVSQPLAQAIAQYESIITADKGMKSVYFNDATQRVFVAGERIKQPKLAATFEKLANAADPRKLFYEGELAKQMADEFQANGGIITVEDFKKYESQHAPAVTLKLSNGLTVCGPPAPSGGPVALAILNIIDGYNLSPESVQTIEGTAETYHRIIEAMKFGFSVRSELGDPKFVAEANQIVANITGKKWADYVRSKITSESHNRDYYGGSYQVVDHGTSQFSAIDKHGNAVSMTSTINTRLGAKRISESTGILWNNEMDDFSTPGLVNYFGVYPSPANFIKPGKRPMSSMSPIIIFNDTSGDVRLSVGAAGGSSIITSTAYTAIRDLWLGENIKEAIDAPRIHHQLLPYYAEIQTQIMPKVVLEVLKAKGQIIKDVLKGGSRTYGVEKNFGRILANCDYRKEGGFTSGE